MSFIDSRFVHDPDGKTLYDKTGNLSSLTTTNKGSLVDAVNDVSSQLSQTATKVDARGMNVKSPIGTGLTPAKGDGVTDDYAALQAIIDYCLTNEIFQIFFPSGTYNISQPLLVKSSLKSGTGWWDGKGMKLVGADKATTKIVKTTSNVLTGVNSDANNLDATLILFTGLRSDGSQGGSSTGIDLTNLFIINQSSSTSSMAITGAACDRMNFERLNIQGYKGIVLGNAFANRFRDIVFYCTTNALVITSGTSNIFEFLYAPNCLNPYQLWVSYSNLLSLAADNATGTVFDLQGGSLLMVSCGTESPKAQYIVKTAGEVTIESLFCHRQTGDSANGLDISNCAILYGSGTGKMKVQNLSILEQTQVTGNSYLYTASDANSSFDLEVGRIVYVQNYTGTANPKLIYQKQRPNASTVGKLSPSGVNVMTRRSQFMPYLGSRGIANTLNNPFVDKAIYLDAANKTKDSLGNDLSYEKPYNKGDLLIINDPSLMNIAGYSVYDNTGATQVSQNVLKEIPIALSGTTASRPNANLYIGMMYFDTTLNKPTYVKTTGVTEKDTLTISAGATTSGNITITVGGVSNTVAVTAGDSASTIGDKIRATAFTGWVLSGTGATVIFDKIAVGSNTAPSYSDTGTTGTTASFVVTRGGSAAAWVDATGATV